MGTSAGGVYVDLGLNAARFHAGMKRAGAELNTFGATARKAGGIAKAALAGVGDGLKLGLAGLTIGGAFAGVRKAASDLAQLGAEAKRAGLGVEAFQELAYAARQSLVGVDALTDGMKELQLRADEFISTGQGSAAEAFGRLGYSAKELTAKLADPAALFEEIIDKLSRLDKAAQIRIADELFGGTGGEQFVQMLDKGAGYIGRMRKEIRDTGSVFSDDMIRKAEELNRQFEKIATTVSNGLNKAIISTVLAMAQFIDMFNKVASQDTATLQKRLDLAKEALPRYKNYGFPDSYVKEREQEIAALEKEIASRPPRITITPAAPGSAPPKPSAGKAAGTKTANDYERLTQAITERRAALVAETEAQAGLNPLLDDYGFALEKARAAHDLLTAATAAGLEITPALRQSIDDLAASYAATTVAAAELAERQDNVRRAAEDFGDIGRSALGGFISDIKASTSAADALANALDNIADRLTDLALNALFDTSGGGILSTLLGGLAKGGPVSAGGIGHAATGGRIRGFGTGTSDSVPMMLSNGEYVVNAKQAARYAPLLEAINSGRVGGMAEGGLVAPRIPAAAQMAPAGRGGDTFHVTMNMPINAPGADAAALERLRKEVVQLKQGIPKQAVEAILNARKRNVRI